MSPATQELLTGPGLPCKQCYGDVIRLGGELVCGTCGWPAERALPARPALTVGMDSQNAELRQRVSTLEAENAELRQARSHPTEAEQAANREASRQEIKRKGSNK